MECENMKIHMNLNKTAIIVNFYGFNERTGTNWSIVFELKFLMQKVGLALKFSNEFLECIIIISYFN